MPTDERIELDLEDLSEFGLYRLQDDFDKTDRRGKRTSLTDFGYGWMAAMIRLSQWSYFKAEARRRLEK